MELKVHVESKTRIVSGINQDTTVQDIIIALAYSLKQTGRFYLFEKFVYTDDGESKAKRLPRIMAPNEKPVQVLKAYVDYLTPDECIEFHLVKSSIDPVTQAKTLSTSGESRMKVAQHLLKTVTKQERVY
jgi:hypothetical protein